ncbi:tubulin-binding prefolding complex subunit [Martiniozyma asiatica (nom. inval.)]|nr:tubulin-binding prefolding complex subunit [Martiniozyma asiatica]
MDVSELQTQLQTLLTTRQKLETQFQENKIVLEELAGVPEDAKVYKLVGPVLLPQQHDDAVGNVEKRLEFIQKEIESVETRMDGLRKKAAEINAAS